MIKTPHHRMYSSGEEPFAPMDINLQYQFSVHFNSLMHKFHIQSYTTVVDFLVDVVFFPDTIWNREFVKLLPDTHFSFNITDVISLKRFPLIRSMKRSVSGSAAVGFSSSARLTEVFDEVFSFSKFLFFQVQELCRHLPRIMVVPLWLPIS